LSGGIGYALLAHIKALRYCTTASMTEKVWFRHYELFSDNLRRYLSKQPLRFVVDKHKGY